MRVHIMRQAAHVLSPKLLAQFSQPLKGYGTMIKPPQHPAPLRAEGEIIIPAQITVSQLAALLSQKTALIIADLMQMGFFAGASQFLGLIGLKRLEFTRESDNVLTASHVETREWAISYSGSR